ncbi:unnamed protein product [Ectocarpus sp. 12 AP-2014]
MLQETRCGTSHRSGGAATLGDIAVKAKLTKIKSFSKLHRRNQSVDIFATIFAPPPHLPFLCGKRTEFDRKLSFSDWILSSPGVFARNQCCMNPPECSFLRTCVGTQLYDVTTNRGDTRPPGTHTFCVDFRFIYSGVCPPFRFATPFGVSCTTHDGCECSANRPSSRGHTGRGKHWGSFLLSVFMFYPTFLLWCVPTNFASKGQGSAFAIPRQR